MKAVFDQSVALDAVPAARTRLAKRDLKLINISKSTDNESILNKEDLTKKINRMKKEGIIDFSLEQKYCLNLDGSISFKHDDASGDDMAKKIEIVNKRKILKTLADDSRLDDSRKYLINGDTP